MHRHMFGGRNIVLSSGFFMTGLFSFYGGYQYSRTRQSALMNVPFFPGDHKSTFSFEALTHLFNDPFNERACELRYLIDKQANTLAESQINQLAMMAIANGHGHMLNVLTQQFPDILNSKSIFQLLKDTANPNLIQALLLMHTEQLSPSLKPLFTINSQSIDQTLCVIYADDFKTFFKRVHLSNVQNTTFIAHNGKFHDDGRVIQGTYSRDSNQLPHLVVTGADDNQNVRSISEIAQSIDPSICLTIDVKTERPTNFRP